MVKKEEYACTAAYVPGAFAEGGVLQEGEAWPC